MIEGRSQYACQTYGPATLLHMRYFRCFNRTLGSFDCRSYWFTDYWPENFHRTFTSGNRYGSCLYWNSFTRYMYVVRINRIKLPLKLNGNYLFRNSIPTLFLLWLIPFVLLSSSFVTPESLTISFICPLYRHYPLHLDLACPVSTFCPFLPKHTITEE